MITQMYAVRDRGVEAYGSPFFCRAKGEAIRSFMDACSDPKVPFGKYPNDYALYFLGTYDDTDGKVMTPEGGPVLILTADDVVRQASLDVSGAPEPFVRSPA